MSKLVKLTAALVLVGGLMMAAPNNAQAYWHGGWHGGHGWRVGGHGWRGGWRWHRWGWHGRRWAWRAGWGPWWGWRRPVAFYPQVYAAGLRCGWVTVPVWRHHHRVWHHVRRCW